LLEDLYRLNKLSIHLTFEYLLLRKALNQFLKIDVVKLM
jgi:hypothetical protein